ncbi:MAG: flagellar biosynthetic protein FliO [Oscillospiraceae bacterium]|nr:flagellar biosynthetic protein FliO [Oscillospiraceae bacterium]
MTQVLPVALALLGVIALMIGAMFGLKWLTGKVSFKGSGGMKIISALSLGQDKTLYAVEAGSRKLLIGASGGSLSLICELSEEDMALLKGSTPNAADMQGKSFSEVLRQNMKKMGGEFIRPYQKNDGNENGDGENSDS